MHPGSLSRRLPHHEEVTPVITESHYYATKSSTPNSRSKYIHKARLQSSVHSSATHGYAVRRHAHNVRLPQAGSEQQVISGVLLRPWRVREIAPERAVERCVRVTGSRHECPRTRQVFVVVISLPRLSLTVFVDAEQILCRRRGRGGRLRRGGRDRGGERGAILPGRRCLRCGGRVRDARVDGAQHADRGGREKVCARDGNEDLARERIERGAVGERFSSGAADEGLQGLVSVRRLGGTRATRTSGFLWYILPSVPVCRSS